MEATLELILRVLFGAVGLGFFTYGTRQKAIVPLFTAVALFMFPYFVSNVYLLGITGFALISVPYFIRF